MAGNTVNSIGTNTRKELIPSESQYIPQLVVFITEYLAINFLNLIAVIEFVKQRQLQRRSTHLVIHLAIIDLLAGAVSGPLDILWVGSVCDLWEYTQKIHLPSVVLRAVFPNASLVNLTAISLERAHTTICSFKQCLIKKQVYGVIIISFGLLNQPGQQEVDVSRSLSLSTILCFFSSFFILFFMTIVSYISVFITVRSNRHMHSNSAAGAREKKIDDYVIYCDNWIFNCLFSIDDTTRCFHVSSLVRQRYYLAAIITYWKNSSSIIRGHLAHKSYYLCHAGTRTRRNVMEINFRRTSNCSKPSDIPLRQLCFDYHFITLTL